MTNRAVLLLGLALSLTVVACSGSEAGSSVPLPASSTPPPPPTNDVPNDPGKVTGTSDPPAKPAGCGGAECATAQFTDKIWTWDQTKDACSYSNNGNPFWDWVVQGREPAPAGRFPVFLYLVGTGDVATSPVALNIVERMAARGFVAASVPYASLDGMGAVMGDPKQACTIAPKKGDCLFGAGQGSAVTRICKRAKADCALGIVVAGHSQGAWLATLARNHEPRVRAAFGMGSGVHESVTAFNITVASDLSACILPGTRALPADRLRVVNGQAEYVYGTNLEADTRAITGQDCPAGKLDCLRPNGSGWVFFPNSASETDEAPDGTRLARHCYFANTPPGDCGGNYVGLNSSWDKGTAAYAREPNLTWLASFADPPSLDP